MNRPVRLPALRPTASVVSELLTLLAKEGGATVCLRHGDLAGDRLYAVARYPERSLIVTVAALTAELVSGFVEANRALLAEPGNAVGAWLEHEARLLHLDIATVVATLHEAIGLARRHRQRAVFDLQRRCAIACDEAAARGL